MCARVLDPQWGQSEGGGTHHAAEVRGESHGLVVPVL